MSKDKVRFQFTRNFDWLARRCLVCCAVTIAFKAGHRLLIPRDAADAAQAAGAGHEVGDA